ncbi:MAG: Gfo/Idh/MocA family oxidoreductase, partial [Desulfobulbaceae bacterium]|nr:Gfo/Idh/MocA family oxidoreductase [Desulfobulbaceae bacterium]
ESTRDWRELVCSDKVDAVIAVTYPTLNLEIARFCAEHGKALLLEKPMAASAGEAGEIKQLFADRGLKLTVGQTLRYNNVVMALRDYLPDMGMLFSFSANQRLEPSTLDWHDEPKHAGAGVSFHTAVHVFDALRFITGRNIVRVFALCRSRINLALEDMLCVLVEMEGGVVGTVDCSKVGAARTGRFEFVAKEGQLHGDQIHDTLDRIRGAQREGLTHSAPVSTIVPLLCDWFDYLVDRGPNPVSGEDGRLAVRACEACILSAKSGEWVDVV